MKISKREAAAWLLSHNNYLILTHEDPDGDAAGSACGLCAALRSAGKTAYAAISGCPRVDEYIYEPCKAPADFKYEHIVTVDTADRKILGAQAFSLEKDCPVSLNIDHHISNKLFGEMHCVDSDSAAAAQVVYDILNEAGIKLTKAVAECLYIGIATDTGCFRYGNTNASALRAAAEFVETGIELSRINKEQFETKSRQFLEIEKLALLSTEIHFGGKCAMICISNEAIAQSGAGDTELKPLSALPRQIEGVIVGVTLKERVKGKIDISVRTNEPANASLIAGALGGGGHVLAAGCTLKCDMETARQTVLLQIETELKRLGL